MSCSATFGWLLRRRTHRHSPSPRPIGLPVRMPLHPRTRGALERFGLMEAVPRSVTLEVPLGYLETLAAVRDAAVVITDSGGVQREAYWLGTPCITVRTET